MRAPSFWNKSSSVWACLLKPASWIYAYFVNRRFQKATPYQASVPVVCVGNLSVGGTGKTPICLALADFLKKKRKNFFFLNHGYKSRLQHVLVNPKLHTAFDVGDEAMLLAEKAPTVVDSNRARGAQLAEKKGAACLIMDDGFQNPFLIKTVSFVVMDGKKGFGNELVLPAGPLREPILKGLERADAVIIVGQDVWGVRSFFEKNKIDLPVLTGTFSLKKRAITALQGKKITAFAGIGYPEKFFDMLKANGLSVVKTIPFPDHYYYTRFDIETLLKESGDSILVTTAKDMVKIPKEFQKRIFKVEGVFEFDQEEMLFELLKGMFENE